jgi:hypothetical protein
MRNLEFVESSPPSSPPEAWEIITILRPRGSACRMTTTTFTDIDADGIETTHTFIMPEEE